MRLVLSTLLVLLVTGGSALAADRFVAPKPKGNDASGGNSCLSVPTPCLTLGNALAHANSGDVIKVAKGTYKENVSISTAGTWTIRGGYDRSTFSEATRDVIKNRTIVTGGPKNRFLFIHADSGDAISVGLDGLSVKNSTARFPVTPIFSCCGGGILGFADGGSITLNLHQVTMTANHADDGGALYLEAGNGSVIANITASVFEQNKAQVGGGAISLEAFTGGSVELTVEDATFQGNKAFSGGAITMGGRDTPGVTARIRRTLFLKNTGVRVKGGSIGAGGAIRIVAQDFLNGAAGNATLTMENSVLQENTAGTGGALHVQALISTPPDPQGTASVVLDLRNNTLVGNKATFSNGGFGGGINAVAFGDDGAPAGSSTVTGTLLNNIVRGNTAAGFPSSGDILFFPQGDGANTSLTLVTNNVGLLANFGTISATPDPQLNVDPQLVKKQGVYRLNATSPMRGAGTCDGAPTVDFEGDPRPMGTGLCGVDIGADQFVP
jgi:predicted outer membrane repeat protein